MAARRDHDVVLEGVRDRPGRAGRIPEGLEVERGDELGQLPGFLCRQRVGICGATRDQPPEAPGALPLDLNVLSPLVTPRHRPRAWVISLATDTRHGHAQCGGHLPEFAGSSDREFCASCVTELAEHPCRSSCPHPTDCEPASSRCVRCAGPAAVPSPAACSAAIDITATCCGAVIPVRRHGPVPGTARRLITSGKPVPPESVTYQTRCV